MRIIFLLFIGLIVSTTTLVQAQERESGTIEIIPNIGFSSAMIFGESSPRKEPIFDLQYGILGEIYFSDRWSIRSGLSFFTMGASDPYSKLKLDYLNIPINANWHFGNERNWNFNFGITPGFLTKAIDDDENVEVFYESFQLAFSYGVGYKIEVSDRFGILIDLQGIVGITNNLVDELKLKRRNVGASINVGGVFAL